MRTGSWALVSALALLTGAVGSACSSSGTSAGSGGIGAGGAAAGEGGMRDEGGTSGAQSADGGADSAGASAGDGGEAGADASEAPLGCVPSPMGDAPDDEFLDSNCDGIDGDASHAIFVSPGGSDAGDGSRGNPLKTIQHGVEVAGTAKKSVYVCAGEYVDNITIGKDAVSVFGGYDCSDWSRSNARIKVSPPSGSALVIRGATAPVTIDHFELRSADATNAGDSSIAAMLVNSESVTLSNVTITAGAGAAGKPGGNVKPVLTAAPTGASGQDAGSQCNYIDGTVVPSPACQNLRGGGAKVATTCPNGDRVRGGVGGSGGTKAYAKNTAYGTGGTGLPGGKSVNQTPKAGTIGDTGAAASAGFGSVTTEGYLPTNVGADGGIGHAGESGGGGGGGDACLFYDDTVEECRTQLWYYSGALFIGAGGGQGGFGGCGGAGGKGGLGGGASIAVFSYGTKLSILLSSLTSSAGGKGGAPSAGAAGQPGGAAGTGGRASPTNYSSTTPAIQEGQDGTNGANGGPGGPGGAGGGGPSIVVFATIHAPSIIASTLSVGPGGPGGVGIDNQDGAHGESNETKLVDIVDDGAAGAGSQ